MQGISFRVRTAVFAKNLKSSEYYGLGLGNLGSELFGIQLQGCFLHDSLPLEFVWLGNRTLHLLLLHFERKSRADSFALRII